MGTNRLYAERVGFNPTTSHNLLFTSIFLRIMPVATNWDDCQSTVVY
nr:MAG TPA: hypothetical protein [Caudoviricetes sp.]